MTQLILSFSNKAAKMLKQTFDRFETAKGEQVGVKPLLTNSVQVSWQVHAIELKGKQWEPCNDNSKVFFFTEAYSRYTMVKSYSQLPTLDELYDDFLELWFTNIFRQLLMSGLFTNQEQAESIAKQFTQLTHESYQPLLFSNYDHSLGGVISDQISWLQAFIDGKRLSQFDDYEAEDFTDYINQMGRRIRDKNSSRKYAINPVSRFIEDCAFRFAQGLCHDQLADCRGGNFPNPHQHKVTLRVVK